MIEQRKSPISDDEGMIINFAVRYAIGRQSYAPSAVIQYVIPRLPLLSDRTLVVLYKDMLDNMKIGSLGDPKIDAPQCLKFFESIKAEMNNRGLLDNPTYRREI